MNTIKQTLRRTVALTLACALLTSGPLLAEETAPTGEQILDRYIEATGGRAAYDKLDNRHSVMTLDIAGLGLSLDIDVYQAKPNLFYSHVSSPATGDIERGTDGTIFWEKSTMTGGRILEGAELADAVREANFDKFVYWKKLYESAEYIGSDTVDGVLCQKVVLTPKEGFPLTLSFDAGTGLLIQVETTIQHQMGEIPMVAKSSDYREVDGIKVPYVNEVIVVGQSRVITQKLMEHNVEIPDSVFQVPEDIQAMVDAPAPAATE
jgi:hypothetical protein